MERKPANRRTATTSMNSFPQELNQAKLKFRKDFHLWVYEKQREFLKDKKNNTTKKYFTAPISGFKT